MEVPLDEVCVETRLPRTEWARRRVMTTRLSACGVCTGGGGASTLHLISYRPRGPVGRPKLVPRRLREAQPAWLTVPTPLPTSMVSASALSSHLAARWDHNRSRPGYKSMSWQRCRPDRCCQQCRQIRHNDSALVRISLFLIESGPRARWVTPLTHIILPSGFYDLPIGRAASPRR